MVIQTTCAALDVSACSAPNDLVDTPLLADWHARFLKQKDRDKFVNVRSTQEQRDDFLKSVYKTYHELSEQADELQQFRRSLIYSTVDSNHDKISRLLFDEDSFHDKQNEVILGDWETWNKVQGVVKTCVYGRSSHKDAAHTSLADELYTTRQYVSVLSTVVVHQERQVQSQRDRAQLLEDEVGGLRQIVHDKDAHMGQLHATHMSALHRIRLLERELASLKEERAIQAERVARSRSRSRSRSADDSARKTTVNDLDAHDTCLRDTDDGTLCDPVGEVTSRRSVPSSVLVGVEAEAVGAENTPDERPNMEATECVHSAGSDRVCRGRNSSAHEQLQSTDAVALDSAADIPRALSRSSALPRQPSSSSSTLDTRHRYEPCDDGASLADPAVVADTSHSPYSAAYSDRREQHTPVTPSVLPACGRERVSADAIAVADKRTANDARHSGLAWAMGHVAAREPTGSPSLTRSSYTAAQNAHNRHMPEISSMSARDYTLVEPLGGDTIAERVLDALSDRPAGLGSGLPDPNTNHTTSSDSPPAVSTTRGALTLLRRLPVGVRTEAAVRQLLPDTEREQIESVCDVNARGDDEVTCEPNGAGNSSLAGDCPITAESNITGESDVTDEPRWNDALTVMVESSTSSDSALPCTPSASTESNTASYSSASGDCPITAEPKGTCHPTVLDEPNGTCKPNASGPFHVPIAKGHAAHTGLLVRPPAKLNHCPVAIALATPPDRAGAGAGAGAGAVGRREEVCRLRGAVSALRADAHALIAEMRTRLSQLHEACVSLTTTHHHPHPHPHPFTDSPNHSARADGADGAAVPGAAGDANGAAMRLYAEECVWRTLRQEYGIDVHARRYSDPDAACRPAGAPAQPTTERRRVLPDADQRWLLHTLTRRMQERIHRYVETHGAESPPGPVGEANHANDRRLDTCLPGNDAHRHRTANSLSGIDRTESVLVEDGCGMRREMKMKKKKEEEEEGGACVRCDDAEEAEELEDNDAEETWDTCAGHMEPTDDDADGVLPARRDWSSRADGISSGPTRPRTPPIHHPRRRARGAEPPARLTALPPHPLRLPPDTVPFCLWGSLDGAGRSDRDGAGRSDRDGAGRSDQDGAGVARQTDRRLMWRRCVPMGPQAMPPCPNPARHDRDRVGVPPPPLLLLLLLGADDFGQFVRDDVLGLACAVQHYGGAPEAISAQLRQAIRSVREAEQQRRQHRVRHLFRRVVTNYRMRQLMRSRRYRGDAFVSYVALLYHRWSERVQREARQMDGEVRRRRGRLLDTLWAVPQTRCVALPDGGRLRRGGGGGRDSNVVLLPPLVRTGLPRRAAPLRFEPSSAHFAHVVLPHDGHGIGTTCDTHAGATEK